MVQHTRNASLRGTASASDLGPNADLGLPAEFRDGNTQGNRGNHTQLFTFTCDLSHKGD
jgi:hypothetical protein